MRGSKEGEGVRAGGFKYSPLHPSLPFPHFCRSSLPFAPPSRPPLLPPATLLSSRCWCFFFFHLYFRIVSPILLLMEFTRLSLPLFIFHYFFSYSLLHSFLCSVLPLYVSHSTDHPFVIYLSLFIPYFLLSSILPSFFVAFIIFFVMSC